MYLFPKIYILSFHSYCIHGIWVLSYRTNKMKNNILSELSNIKIVERDKFDTPNIQIHDRWFPCLVHTLYSKVVAVILVLWVVILVYGWLYWSYGPKPPFSVKWYDHAIAILLLIYNYFYQMLTTFNKFNAYNIFILFHYSINIISFMFI